MLLDLIYLISAYFFAASIARSPCIVLSMIVILAAYLEFHERVVDVAKTHRSDLGAHTLSSATVVRLLGSHSSSYCAVIAFLLRSMGLFTSLSTSSLRCH